MSGGDFQVAAGHDVWPETDTHRVTMTEFLPEFPEVGNTVDINMHAQLLRFFNFAEGDVVGSIQDVFGGEPGFDSQHHFVDRAAINIATDAFDITEDID